MKSPLNINTTVRRYGLDKKMRAKLIAFDAFIWQDCNIESIEQLVSFEKEYQEYNVYFGFLYDSEIDEFGLLEMNNGPMVFLSRGRFKQFSASGFKDNVSLAFKGTGLSELEILMVETFRADLSAIYRLDTYFYGIPPFIKSICNILNNALSKMPAYSNIVVRECNEYDRDDFKVGELFKPNFCLTTSADLSWVEYSKNRYKISPLDNNQSKARAMFLVDDNGEFQVTFLQDACFRITARNDWGEGKKEFLMEEVQVC